MGRTILFSDAAKKGSQKVCGLYQTANAFARIPSYDSFILARRCEVGESYQAAKEAATTTEADEAISRNLGERDHAVQRLEEQLNAWGTT